MLEAMANQARTSTAVRVPDGTWLDRRVHLIGMGGSGMRALAQSLLGRGAVVSGSDSVPSAALEDLAARGATVAVGQRAENIPPEADLVVRSAAIDPSNPELAAAAERGCEVVKYSEMLGRLMADRCGIAVAGTHGKSTTTAMVSYALVAAGRRPSFIVGATVGQLGGPSGVGSGPHFVAEACEYDRSFLNLTPAAAAILNIEEDHLDCYEDLTAIVAAFRAFTGRVPSGGLLVANGEDDQVASAAAGAGCTVQTFGLAEACFWRAGDLSVERGRYRFGVLCGRRRFCRISLALSGLHNVYNALACVALLHYAELTPSEISVAVGGFEGVDRRMTLRGRAGGVTVLDDYAHHPTEIRATLAAVRETHEPRRLWCVFQPHQHSRTRFLLRDFATSFALADRVIVPDIYFVRDSRREREHISSEDLVAQIRFNGGDAEYRKTFGGIVELLKASLRPGDLVVTMGAGDIWEVADEIVLWLDRDR